MLAAHLHEAGQIPSGLSFACERITMTPTNILVGFSNYTCHRKGLRSMWFNVFCPNENFTTELHEFIDVPIHRIPQGESYEPPFRVKVQLSAAARPDSDVHPTGGGVGRVGTDCNTGQTFETRNTIDCIRVIKMCCTRSVHVRDILSTTRTRSSLQTIDQKQIITLIMRESWFIWTRGLSISITHFMYLPEV